MKYLRKQNLLVVFFCLFSFQLMYAQVVATITSQSGFPVGKRAGLQVAYGHSKYVLLGSYNTLYQSSNAQAWTAVPHTGLTAKSLNHLTFGAGMFVVVGQDGAIQSSPDGIAWTIRASGTTNPLYKVYFENNTFFATGSNRTLLTSSDGINWSAVSFNVGNPEDVIQSLAYGNGWYVVAARTPNGNGAVVYRSPSAANNSWSYNNNAPAGEFIHRIQFLNNKFFAFTSGYTMYQSTDGSSWVNYTPFVELTHPDGSTIYWGTGHQISNGVWDGSRYHFYGSSAYYAGYGSTFTSTDGVALTLLNKSAYIVPQESNIINGIYFVCGNEGVVTSADGLTYQHSGASFNDMVKTANKYVAVGMINSDGQIWNSTNSVAWTNRTPANIKELYTAAYDGSHLLAAGYQNLLRSADEGDTWTIIANKTEETITAMSFGNERFIAGGFHDNDGAFLRYSADRGQTWTIAENGDYTYLKLKYVNNNFFAFALDNDTYLGRILHSADGISWSDITPDLGFEVLYYKDVVFDGTKYHFMGVESEDYDPVGFFTVSTATPVNSTTFANKAVISNVPPGAVLGGSWDEGALDYANGYFVGAVIDVITGQDYILYSTDGYSWTAVPQDSYSVITTSYNNGSSFLLAGRGNGLFSVSFKNTLPVVMSQFNGRLQHSAVELNWVTTMERNTKHFLVQHSADGRTWTTIGTVAAAGNYSAERQYRFMHPSPVPGANLYRLLQEDIDGKGSLSRVVTVHTSNELKVNLYPNPVTDNVVIRSASVQPGYLLLYSAAGQVVKRAPIRGNETRINLSGLTGGTYIAEIRQGEQRQQLTFVKR
jgi:photosystem II stability/assembly factor-like uncharacterized protein